LTLQLLRLARGPAEPQLLKAIGHATWPANPAAAQRRTPPPALDLSLLALEPSAERPCSSPAGVGEPAAAACQATKAWPGARATLPSLSLEHALAEAANVSKPRSSGRSDRASGRRRVSKSVRFCDKGDELFEAFTPYSNVYGEHPRGFVFDEAGAMVQASSPSVGSDVDAVDAGSLVECTVICGVGYRTQPQFPARFDDLRTLDFGERVKIEERSGEWVRDEVGWLPLAINGMPVFEVVNVKRSPRHKCCVGTPRRGVVISEAGE